MKGYLNPWRRMLEDKRDLVSRGLQELCFNASTASVELDWGEQPELLPTTSEGCSTRIDADFMLRPDIVKLRKALYLEMNAPPHHPHLPHDLVRVFRLRRSFLNRHEVDNLPYPFRTQEPSEQDIGLGKIDLLLDRRVNRCNFEKSSLARV